MKYWSNGIAALHHADAREIPLPDASVHMCVTSPPYWGLRDYGLGEWQGGDPKCNHALPHFSSKSTVGGTSPEYPHSNGICGHCGAIQQPAGIGLEPTLAEHIASIVAVFREVRRVLRDDGTLWLNYGDAYVSNKIGRTDAGSPNKITIGAIRDAGLAYQNKDSGLPAKNLLGLPWRVAFALQDDGWILRSAIVWHKPNPMPESVRDRPTSTYENVFLFAKQPRYFYDAEAIRQRENSHWTIERAKHKREVSYGRRVNGDRENGIKGWQNRHNGPNAEPLTGANARNVWTIPTQGRSDAHFATFPDELPRRCILAGTSEHGVCAECGAPYARMIESKAELLQETNNWSPKDKQSDGNDRAANFRRDGNGRARTETQTLGWQPSCECDAGIQPAVVLDPFVGSGTTLAVAQSLGRRGVGLDLNEEYLEIAKRRIEAVSLPMMI